MLKMEDNVGLVSSIQQLVDQLAEELDKFRAEIIRYKLMEQNIHNCIKEYNRKTIALLGETKDTEVRRGIKKLEKIVYDTFGRLA